MRLREIGFAVAMAEIGRRTVQRMTRLYRRVRFHLRSSTLTDAYLDQALSPLPRSGWRDHFTTRSTPTVFPGLDHPAETAVVVRERCPRAVAVTLETAEAVLAHRFRYLGREVQHPTNSIDWYGAVLHGTPWPRAYHATIRYGAGLTPPRDIKLTWELGRFHQANVLGRAYALTGEERFAAEFFTQLESFDDHNPREIGPHWLCAMEVAIRTINFSIAFFFFRSSPECTPDRLARLLRMLYEHAAFIEENLENAYHVTSNHYLSDLAGLLFVGVLFPEFDRARTWRTFAWRELLYELDKQILPDGADWEASTGYHRLVTELFALSLWLGQANGLAMSLDRRTKVARMFDYAGAILAPDGRFPQIGDMDNGQILVWAEREPTDGAYLYPLGAEIVAGLLPTPPNVPPGLHPATFERWDDFFDRANSTMPEAETETLWLFGTVPRCIYPPPGSRSFPNAGIEIMRRGGEYLVFTYGDNGINGQGSHGHNDALSFEVHAGGRRWLVDPGTYAYTGDPEARDLFRSTAYHNTARVNGREINPILPNMPFALGGNVRPRMLDFATDADQDMVECEHDAFAPVGFSRRIVFDKNHRVWTITDRFSGNSSTRQSIELFFNFDIGVEPVECSGKRIVVNDAAGRRFAIDVLETSVPLTAECVDRWVSNGYGHRARSVGVVWRCESALPVVVRWKMASE